MTGYLAFPYQIDMAGRTATTDLAGCVEALVLLVLETTPGERVNRPNFGSGLKSLLFEGLNSALGAAAETLVRGQLTQFLGDVISISGLTISISGEALDIALTYTITATSKQVSQHITQTLPGTTVSSASSGIGAVPQVRVQRA